MGNIYRLEASLRYIYHPTPALKKKNLTCSVLTVVFLLYSTPAHMNDYWTLVVIELGLHHKAFWHLKLLCTLLNSQLL